MQLDESMEWKLDAQHGSDFAVNDYSSGYATGYEVGGAGGGMAYEADQIVANDYQDTWSGRYK
jgi:hypothetical protein